MGNSRFITPRNWDNSPLGSSNCHLSLLVSLLHKCSWKKKFSWKENAELGAGGAYLLRDLSPTFRTQRRRISSFQPSGMGYSDRQSHRANVSMCINSARKKSKRKRRLSLTLIPSPQKKKKNITSDIKSKKGFIWQNPPPYLPKVVLSRPFSRPYSLKAKASCLAPGQWWPGACHQWRITWLLKPVRLCLREKFAFPRECQFHVGTSVPSMTNEPGASSAFSAAGSAAPESSLVLFPSAW